MDDKSWESEVFQMQALPVIKEKNLLIYELQTHFANIEKSSCDYIPSPAEKRSVIFQVLTHKFTCKM